MDNAAYASYKIEDRSYLSFIKREIHNMLTHAGFSSMRTGEVDIIVSELTSNLIKHAGSGELLYRLVTEENNKAFEIISLDNGPGTNDIMRMMKDGMSSANTLGHGLGAINRLSSLFQIYSISGWGTVGYSKSYLQPETQYVKPVRNELNIKAVQVCYPGERVCGDGYFVKKVNDKTMIFMGDGLGHGIHAHEAVSKAIEAFKQCEEEEPEQVLRVIDKEVKKTRGLVATVAVYNHLTKQWKVCGVGNITTRLYEGISYRNFMPHNGILGLNMPNNLTAHKVEDDKYPCIIMYSDGIKSRWDLSKYPSILKYDPSLIATAIFKDNARRTDDMTVLVGKLNL